ncbi:MAG: ribonuclease P protein component [Deltaproteobacteria bacterium]|nr:ribonuclease P protein component [Deltaproteobacteria bacterium]
MTAHPGGSGFGLPKDLRLRKRREFLRIKGARHTSRVSLGNFTVVCAPNGLARNRLGVTATRKAGKSVERNRLKREAREFFRLRQPFWPQGLDILFLARNPPRAEPPLHALAPGEGERRLVKALRRSLSEAARQPAPAGGAGQPRRPRPAGSGGREAPGTPAPPGGSSPRRDGRCGRGRRDGHGRR